MRTPTCLHAISKQKYTVNKNRNMQISAHPKNGLYLDMTCSLVMLNTDKFECHIN